MIYEVNIGTLDVDLGLDWDIYLLMLLLILVELLGFEFLSRLLFCFFISLFLLSELFLESPLLSVLKELERFVLQMNQRFNFNCERSSSTCYNLLFLISTL